MKRPVVLTLCLLLLVAGPAAAVEIAGVSLAPHLDVAGRTLQLNGYGIRTKFFFKIYVGSLYTEKPATTTAAVLADPGPKLIRMNFLYSKVDKEKIIDGFSDGLVKNSPRLAGRKTTRDFLAWFDHDFVKGDQVDLETDPDGTVVARLNGKVLGMLNDPELGSGILLIYLGKEPADSDLKEGMLRGL